MVALILIAAACITGAAFAAGPVISLRDDAPVYAGPVDEGALEELTAADFAAFGPEDAIASEQYRRYRKALEQAGPGTLFPYKMKITGRELTLDDFSGDGVPAQLAEARYDAYNDMEPVTFEGETTHFVYVYHRPLERPGVEYEASNN
jgi:hypothetical protein